MAQPLSSAIMLATSMHAQPGVYAVLLGSGVSTGAGLPTGWGIVKNLVAKVAAQMSTGGTDHTTAAAEDPEAWWAQTFGEALGYSSLLGKLAPTPATRQGVLEGFFEPSGGDEPAGPSKAHHALAQLVKRGAVKVIVTTNFDRLMEQALSAAGIEPQVVSRPEAVAGMRPLAHAPATVIKLHGDYKDVESLNTDEELATYPQPWVDLLARIFEDYGLVVSGWSADWDVALVRAIESAPTRRYPVYWDRRSAKGDNASRLLVARGGHIIDTPDADAMFTELLDNIETLDRLSEPPLTTAMTVARVKRYLPDPLHRIDVHDLVLAQLDRVRAEAATQGTARGIANGEGAESLYDSYFAATRPLLSVLAVGAYHDDGAHDDLWVRVMGDLLEVRQLPSGSYNETAWKLQHYPALLAYTTLGTIALARSRDKLFIRLSDEPTWKSPFDRAPARSVEALHQNWLLESEHINTMPRWERPGQRWLYPQSHLLRVVLEPVITEVLPVSRYHEAIDDFEYATGLLQRIAPGGVETVYPPNAGEFAVESKWDGTEPLAERRLRVRHGRLGLQSPWNDRLGDPIGDTGDVLANHRQHVQRGRRWG
ncbi:SIR2 family protein [Cellulomonas sp. NPDC057328]|uniref:SIR2 family protein n=1 Tax=Cellulomonas sp. NPDC057328 TaxID=3346101 RepID=UPI003635283A